MRRTTLALALLGAVAATGCGVQSKPAPTGQNKGVENNKFTMEVIGDEQYVSGGTIYMLPKGGTISGSGLNCGITGLGTTASPFVYNTTCKVTTLTYSSVITLTANRDTASGYTAVMFAGAAAGNKLSYDVTMSSDKFVAVRFAIDAASLGAHPNFSNGTVHVDEYMRWAQNAPGALTCNSVSCHGVNGQGAGYAPACTSCHHHTTTPKMPPNGADVHAIPFPVSAHGPAYANATLQCTQCHGATLAGGAGPTCAKCHTYGVHAVGAFTAPKHDAPVVYDSATCGQCHEATWANSARGPDPKGARLASNCDDCHLMTHPQDGSWNSPEVHGPAYLADQTPTPKNWCTSCHAGGLLGTGLAGGKALSCATCHKWPLGGHFDPTGAMAGHESGQCARCHNGYGFRDYIGADGTPPNFANPPYTGSATGVDATAAFQKPGQMQCNTCHNPQTILGTATGYALNSHKFASGKTPPIDGVTAICAQCHDGARPKYNIAQLSSVLGSNSSVGADQQLTTSNAQVRAHYLSAASIIEGSAAAGAYQYAGNIYTAANEHGGAAKCTFCHNAHTGELPPDSAAAPATINPWEIGAKCGGCHFDELSGAPVRTLLQIDDQRQFGFEGDIDGDLAIKGLKLEIDGLGAKLLVAIQAYGKNVAGTGAICTADNKWFYDNGRTTNVGTSTAGNGICEQAEILSGCSVGVPDPAKPGSNLQSPTQAQCEAVTTPVQGVWQGADNSYVTFTPRLLKATFNYLMYQTDPGAWAHNPRYMVEILYDTIADLNVGLGDAFVSNGKRAFSGHFGAAEDPSPYAAMIYHGGANAKTGEVLPVMGFTSGACYQCHGGTAGLAEYLKAPTAPAWPAATTPATSAPYVAYQVDAMQCSACHTFNGTDMKGVRSDVTTIYFPPQKVPTATPNPGVVQLAAANTPPSFAVCANCHSGRENGQSIWNKIQYGGTATGGTTTTVTFANTTYGTDAFKGATVTFASAGANNGLSRAVTASAKGSLTFAALPEAVVAGDTFVVVFSDADYKLGFTNPHYLGAAGMMLGSNGGVMVHYGTLSTYSGYPVFWNGSANNGGHGSPHGGKCASCHAAKFSKHTFEIDLTKTVATGTWGGAYPLAGMQPGDTNIAACTGCHAGPYALDPKITEFEEAAGELLAAIRMNVAINVTAVKAGAVAVADAAVLKAQNAVPFDQAALDTALANQVVANALTNVCYNGAANPYFFIETASGCSATSFGAFNPKLLKAAFNYQWTQKEPGAWAHNEFYVLQVIYDSILDVGGLPGFKVAAVKDAGGVPVPGDPLNRGY
jgi:hypothetical protein